MKLEIGMYVRTQNGLISKIQGINEYSIALKNTCCERLRDKYFTFPNEEKIYEITKASFNIIDLIELGDYVNGSKVSIIENNGKALGVYEDYIYENEIKEILTKEQYEANVYRLGE